MKNKNDKVRGRKFCLFVNIRCQKIIRFIYKIYTASAFVALLEEGQQKLLRHSSHSQDATAISLQRRPGSLESLL